MKSARKELIYFFLIAFGWMWGLNLPRVLASYELINLPPLLSAILQYTAVFGPGVAAFILTGIQSGKAGVKALWRRGWKLNASKEWLFPALVLVPVAGLLTLGLLLLLGQPIYWEYALPPAMIVPIGLIIWLLGALPEEYGWRGYALDRLQAHSNPLVAGLLLGALWGIWHLPLHFIAGTTQAAIPIWEYLAQTLVLSLLYTWLHNGSGGSVLIAGLFHASGNLTGALIPYWVTGPGRWISFGMLLVPLVVLLVRRSPYLQADQSQQAKARNAEARIAGVRNSGGN